MKPLFCQVFLALLLLATGVTTPASARSIGQLTTLTVGPYTSSATYTLTGPYTPDPLAVVQTYRNTSPVIQDSLLFSLHILGMGYSQTISKFFGALKGLGPNGGQDTYDLGDASLPMPGSYTVYVTVFVFDRDTKTWSTGLSQGYWLVPTARPLPVTLISFAVTTGPALRDSVALDWYTAAEENCFGFWTQHSPDGVTWADGSFLPSQGSLLIAGSRHHYHVKEKRFAQRTYYRMRQVDTGTGHQTYSPVQVVEGLVASGLTLTANSIYPNPAREQATVPGAAGTLVKVYDAQGRLSARQLLDGSERLDVRQLPPGTYLLVVNEKRTRLTVGN